MARLTAEPTEAVSRSETVPPQENTGSQTTFQTPLNAWEQSKPPGSSDNPSRPAARSTELLQSSLLKGPYALNQSTIISCFNEDMYRSDRFLRGIKNAMTQGIDWEELITEARKQQAWRWENARTSNLRAQQWAPSDIAEAAKHIAIHRLHQIGKGAQEQGQDRGTEEDSNLQAKRHKQGVSSEENNGQYGQQDQHEPHEQYGQHEQHDQYQQHDRHEHDDRGNQRKQHEQHELHGQHGQREETAPLSTREALKKGEVYMDGHKDEHVNHLPVDSNASLDPILTSGIETGTNGDTTGIDGAGMMGDMSDEAEIPRKGNQLDGPVAGKYSDTPGIAGDGENHDTPGGAKTSMTGDTSGGAETSGQGTLPSGTLLLTLQTGILTNSTSHYQAQVLDNSSFSHAKSHQQMLMSQNTSHLHNLPKKRSLSVPYSSPSSSSSPYSGDKTAGRRSWKRTCFAQQRNELATPFKRAAEEATAWAADDFSSPSENSHLCSESSSTKAAIQRFEDARAALKNAQSHLSKQQQEHDISACTLTLETAIARQKKFTNRAQDLKSTLADDTEVLMMLLVPLDDAIRKEQLIQDDASTKLRVAKATIQDASARANSAAEEFRRYETVLNDMRRRLHSQISDITKALSRERECISV